MKSQIARITSRNAHAFAVACYDENSIAELRAVDLIEADEAECKRWGVTAPEWRLAISAALADRVAEEDGEQPQAFEDAAVSALELLADNVAEQLAALADELRADHISPQRLADNYAENCALSFEEAQPDTARELLARWINLNDIPVNPVFTDDELEQISEAINGGFIPCRYEINDGDMLPRAALLDVQGEEEITTAFSDEIPAAIALNRFNAAANALCKGLDIASGSEFLEARLSRTNASVPEKCDALEYEMTIAGFTAVAMIPDATAFAAFMAGVRS